jgi:hypothetical protein
LKATYFKSTKNETKEAYKEEKNTLLPIEISMVN